MKINSIDYKINLLGMFVDKELENEYIQLNLKNSIDYIKLIILFLEIFNILFIILDYFVVDTDSFNLICIGRIIFALFIITLYFRINYIKNFKVLTKWVTINEVIYIFLFLFAFYNYDSPNYLIQAFGVIILIMGIFIIPNYFINIIVLSVVVIVLFNVISFYFIKGIKISELLAGIVNLTIVLILLAIVTYRNNYYKRVHFIDNKYLTTLSETDPLTAVYNKSKLNCELIRNIQFSKRFNTPLSIMIIDIDDFKKVNDTYGHLIGDQIIVEFVTIIQDNIREVDILGRWGGEEFIIILPNTEISQAIEMGNRLRHVVETYNFTQMKNITCSIGVNQLSKEDDFYSFIKEADEMLYGAKDAGKNTVMG